jgi:hypothetical protein
VDFDSASSARGLLLDRYANARGVSWSGDWDETRLMEIATITGSGGNRGPEGGIDELPTIRRKRRV